MYRVRRWVGGAVVLCGALLLSGCTVAGPFGIRLNTDGTVDFTDCTSAPSEVRVDYGYTRDISNDVEWEATLTAPASVGMVVRYGDPAYESTVLVSPPTDWTWVSANGQYVLRDELEVGQWVWYTSPLPFVPDRPCAYVIAEELAR